MKSWGLIISGLILVTNNYSQSILHKSSFYGIQMYQAATASGYGGSYNINVNYQKDQKVFELGCLFSRNNRTFMGFEFLYKRFFGFNSLKFYNRLVNPYLHYNFIFRSPQEIVVKQSDNNYSSLSGGQMRTFEHAIGFGLQVKLFSNLRLDANAGFGVYLGSKYQGSTPSTIGIHRDNYGFVPSFKVGFGYQF
jgi:hypothetical protein